MRRRPGGGVLFVSLFFLLATPLGTAAHPKPEVVVTFDHGQMTVQVRETTTLALVVEELCRQTGTRCEIGPEEQETLTAEVVAPQVFRGTWADVLSRLFAGTELNYASVPGRLLVEARRPVTEFATRPGRRSPATARERDDLADRADQRVISPSRHADPNRSRNEDNRQEADPTAQSGADADVGRGRSLSAAPTVPAEPPASPAAVTFMDQPIIPWVGPRMSPFPDENGNPVPLSGQPITVSPFPDENGNPVAVKPLAPGQPRGSPFPPPSEKK